MAAFVKLAVFVYVLVFPTVSWAQHKVVLDKDVQEALGLQPSPYYVVYTTDEYHRLLDLDQKSRLLVEKLRQEIQLQQQTISDLKLSVSLLQQDMKKWRKYGYDAFNRWSECDLKWRQAQVGSWWPWVITAAALVGMSISSGFAVYYKYK